jgi:hypothetical protein
MRREGFSPSRLSGAPSRAIGAHREASAETFQQAGKTDQASALMTAARNTGGSIGISIVSNILTHREQFHQSRLVERAGLKNLYRPMSGFSA